MFDARTNLLFFALAIKHSSLHNPAMGYSPKDFRQMPPQPSGKPPSGKQTMRGVANRFTFENAESNFAIVRFTPDEDGGGGRKGEEIVVTGPLAHAELGESLEVEGEWSHNSKFGWQFAVSALKQVPPTSAEGIRAFLGSGMIAGIGETYAKRIVEAFGEDTLKVIDNEPERLREVEGIGPKRFNRICEGWSEHRDVAEIMSFLRSFAISATWAPRIYKLYGYDAVTVMRKDPYRLALDFRGMGFSSADKIARSAGIPADSPRRIQAGVLHMLREGAGHGNTFMPFDLLMEKGLEMLGIGDPQQIRTATSELCKANASDKGALAVAEKLHEGDKAVYLKGLHHAETNVASYVESLVCTGKLLPKIDIKAEMAYLDKEGNLKLADKQRQAVEMTLHGGVSVLTGGPGTGKTTTVHSIITLLGRNRVELMLAAPTGRAAKRLSETTRRDAATIHRMLKYDPKEGGFAYNQDNPLPADYIIVDEASMLDVALMHQLLKAIAPTASLLLVGDVDQLPSVGAGNVLRDLIHSGRVPVTRLDTIFRQAQRSLIVRNAHLINQGEFPILTKEESTGNPDFYFVYREEPEEVLETIVDLVRERIPKAHGFDPIRDIQVITPMHRAILGAGNLNKRLQEALNKETRVLTRGNLSIKVGDKVMQRVNNYDKDVFNGDIGVVNAINRTDHVVSVLYGRRIIPYEYGDLDELTLSYAITVHKSQGSEYPVVVIPVHTQHFIMLQRNLIYTALTRGKKLVVMVGTKKALAIAIKNDKIEERHSGLRQRLKYDWQDG